jgi:hypothetical protein
VVARPRSEGGVASFFLSAPQSLCVLCRLDVFLIGWVGVSPEWRWGCIIVLVGVIDFMCFMSMVCLPNCQDTFVLPPNQLGRHTIDIKHMKSMTPTRTIMQPHLHSGDTPTQPIRKTSNRHKTHRLCGADKKNDATPPSDRGRATTPIRNTPNQHRTNEAYGTNRHNYVTPPAFWRHTNQTNSEDT